MSIETASSDINDHEALIHGLLKPRAYPHPVSNVELIETHISWILLAGEFAYKIKKPVELGFLDFSTLERRHHYCLEELRLNRRLVPSLYLDVVSIVGPVDRPRVGATGDPIEYALKMRRFPQSAQLDRMLEAGRVNTETMDVLAAEISRFHESVPVATTADAYGTPEHVMAPARENFDQILPLIREPQMTKRLYRLKGWFEDRYRQLFSELAWRKQHGYVRECHGDLHLSNLVKLEGQITAFDCIEFDPELRWIDVIDDTAFLMMDLLVRERPDLAFHFMNVYLEYSGDYRGLRLLSFYMAHRSIVRAKVALLRTVEGDLSAAETAAALARFSSHVSLAESLSGTHQPGLVITHGLSGSGKTWLTRRLAPRIPAFWIRSDIERKRLYGLRPQEHSDSGVGTGLYASEVSRHTYDRLAELSRIVLSAGYTVIVDAAFLQEGQRLAFQQLASMLNVPFVILWCEAPMSCLQQRIGQRSADATDASEATTAVLDYQLRNVQPPKGEESTNLVKISTKSRLTEADLDGIRNQILRLIASER